MNSIIQDDKKKKDQMQPRDTQDVLTEMSDS